MYLTRGCCQVEGNANVRATELPIGTWTEAYKVFVEKAIALGALGITDYEDRVDRYQGRRPPRL